MPALLSSPLAWALIAALLVVLLRRGQRRLELSRAKHRSLAGHARLSRWVAKFVPRYDFDESRIFRADDAPPEIEQVRRNGFMRLAAQWSERHPRSQALGREAEEGISDLQFTARYRVPFPFSRFVRQYFKGGSFAESSEGVTITDLDGNRVYDLTGSYGVNLLGYDFYKECIRRGSALVENLGPILGTYHPLTVDNVRRLREISGLEEVSFHMSGTEAVMQAVRLARYHTRRNRVVRFCGAYHGWWGDVQPGVGNPVPARDTYTLKDMDPRSLRVLRHRRDIACVLVNPLQALHPNASAPGDSTLVDSSRRGRFDRAAYTAWLEALRAVCTERGIVLIFDEVFVGFRLARGGAQEYFGVRADMVTYGKTVGGGLPIGVVCGRGALMKRFREEHPADVCFARGTFNTHPYVMGAMHEFLRRLDTGEVRAHYRDLDALWNGRAARLNERLRARDLPVEVVNLSSIWMVRYLRPSRYNWMFQYYLRDQGVLLSWVGTGRLIFSLNYTEAEFEEVLRRFLAAAAAMQRDGWWWTGTALDDRAIRRRILGEMLQAGRLQAMRSVSRSIGSSSSSIGSMSSPRSR
jgi:glutamate-1-semialdehyde 2,1-aminomutase